MRDLKSNKYYGSMPPQKLASSKKDKAWREANVDAVCGMSSSVNSNGRTNINRKQTAYNIVNSIFDIEDMKYVLDPYDQGTRASSQPAKMRNMNQIVNKINLLKGEEMNRPFSHRLISVGGEAVSAKENKKKEMMFQVAIQKIAKELGISLTPEIDPETGQEIPKTFAEVDKFMSYSYSDIREKWGNSILQYVKHKEKLTLKFNEGWEHALIAAEEIYYVGIVNGEVKVRACNPLNCDFDRNPDNPCIEDGDWFKEERFMTAGQILDEFNEVLTETQIKDLDEGRVTNGITNSEYPGFVYPMADLNKRNSRTDNSSHILVSHVVWKSMEKVGFVTYPDENGESQTGIVDETFKLSPEMKEIGYVLEWRWISKIWHGTKIGGDMYVQIEPMPNQSRSMDNPSSVKLPYIGRVYNATNSIPTSLVDLLKPHQYLYNVIWFRLESEIAKAKGKKMVMDIAKIPKSEGIDMDKWMHFFDNVGIAFINSMEEGREGDPNSVSQFNQFTAIDMTLSQSVGQYINVLSKIEMLIDKIVGITPQREGAIHQSETATGTVAAVNNSSIITEPWFYMHNEVKTQVLTQVLETAKFAYPGTKKIHYILDDMERIHMEIDMEKFSDSDYGAFVSNSTQDNMIFNKLESLVPQGFSAGMINFSDAIAMFKSQSVAELGNLIKDSEKKRQELEQQQSQQQSEMQQQMLEAQAQEKDKDRQFEAEQNQLDRENALQKAALSVAGFDPDTADNGTIDVIEQSKLMMDQSKENNKNSLERMKISQSSSEAAKDRALKEKEIASKEKIEKLKAETSLKNKVTGEK